MAKRSHIRGRKAQELESNSESRKLLSELRENQLSGRERQIDADRLVAFAAALAEAGKYLEDGDSEGDEYWSPLEKEYRKLSADFVSYLQNTCSLPLVSSLRDEYTFDGEELEILLIAAASAIGAMDSIRDIDDLQELFPSFRRSRMHTARMLLPESRLVMSGLIILDEEPFFKKSSIAVNPHFAEAILRGKNAFSPAWNCSTQEELLKKLPLIRRAVEKAVNSLDDGFKKESSYARKEKRELDRLIKLFLNGVKPEWKLAEIFTPDMDMTEAIILIVLLGGAMLRDSSKRRFWADNDDECSGENLAKAAADTPDEANEIVRNHLSATSRLTIERLIAPILAGSGELHEDDEDTIRELTFQLTNECLAKIGVKRRRAKDSGGRKPLLRMEQLELSGEVRQMLELAVNQYACRDVLDMWKLGKTISYGRAVTMLFYGPPGVGKTAAAEAVAAMLKKHILVADYSQIQNCWVGETEKNIANIFYKARESDCVLFWDEADAMFYDRETASHNWEVRDVNVLLQELEKFDGVCILSTNRKVELDKALARRISLKIEFKPPTREQAKAIWKKLLPDTLPLTENVDFTALSSHDLTGGEIKNVILNAARRAAVRGRKTKLDMADFDWAISAELSGKDLQGRGGRKLGF